jgi:hypothetical protein
VVKYSLGSVDEYIVFVNIFSPQYIKYCNNDVGSHRQYFIQISELMNEMKELDLCVYFKTLKYFPHKGTVTRVSACL